MNLERLTTGIYSALGQIGSRGKIISVGHLNELQKDLARYRNTGILDEDFYQKELNEFDWENPDDILNAESLIVTAIPQNKVEISLELHGRKYYLTIPPTYAYHTDSVIEKALSVVLKKESFFIKKARLPLKLLSVRSGLAKYGKNNIAYVKGMGSFYRLAAFYTNMPCLKDNWQEVQPLEACIKCDKCLKACPTGAISEDRFLLHAERCLTYLNEFPGDFPNWVNPKWHNCVVGCLLCQNACPVNKNKIFKGGENILFPEEEGKLLLEENSENKLSSETLDKLEKLGLLDNLNVLPRNLNVLIKNY